MKRFTLGLAVATVVALAGAVCAKPDIGNEEPSLRLELNLVDGSCDVEKPGAPLWDHPVTKLVIGNAASASRSKWTDYYFDGLLDELQLWNRALSKSEGASSNDRVLPARDRLRYSVRSVSGKEECCSDG